MGPSEKRGKFQAASFCRDGSRQGSHRGLGFLSIEPLTPLHAFKLWAGVGGWFVQVGWGDRRSGPSTDP